MVFVEDELVDTERGTSANDTDGISMMINKNILSHRWNVGKEI